MATDENQHTARGDVTGTLTRRGLLWTGLTGLLGILSGPRITSPPSAVAQPSLTKLYQVVNQLIETSAASGRRARHFFDRAPAASLDYIGLVDDDKRVILYSMNRTRITNYIQGTEGQTSWNRLDPTSSSGFHWSKIHGEWPKKDPNPACFGSSGVVAPAYPDPTPELYTCLPLDPKGGVPATFEVTGRGLVGDYLSGDFRSTSRTVPITDVEVEGTFRCGSAKFKAVLPYDATDPTYELYLKVSSTGQSVNIPVQGGGNFTVQVEP